MEPGLTIILLRVIITTCNFNDATINNNIDVMIYAYRYYGKEEYLQSIIKAGNYIIESQIEVPESGWAQQYDVNLNPAWGSNF